jgi:hypothetical protein
MARLRESTSRCRYSVPALREGNAPFADSCVESLGAGRFRLEAKDTKDWELEPFFRERRQ